MTLSDHRPAPVLSASLAAAVLLSLCALVSCGAPALPIGRLVFIPQLPDESTKWKDQVAPEVSTPTAASIRPGPFTINMEILDDAARSEYLRKALGREGDPFGPVEGLPRFVTVRMEVRNEAKDDLAFNPQQIILVTDAPDYVQPLDATRLHEGISGPEADDFLRDMHKALYDTSVKLRPGETITRLLVIPFPHTPFGLARLECAQFLVGQQFFSFDVPMLPVPMDAPPGQPGESGDAGAPPAQGAHSALRGRATRAA